MIAKHRLTIQRKGRSAWEDVKDIWATVKPLNANERLQYQRLDSNVSHKVNMRYEKGLMFNSSIRFKFNDRILSIEGRPININEENKELEFNCSETFLN